MKKNRIKLVDLCAQVEAKLLEMGFKEDSIGRYRKAWLRLREYCTDEYYDEEETARFLQANCSFELEHGCKKFLKSQMYLLRATRTLSEFRRFGSIQRKGQPFAIIWPEAYRESIQAFLSDSVTMGKSVNHQKRLVQELKKFVQYADRAGIASLSDISPAHITGFTATLNGYAPKTIATTLSCLRIFFEYAYRNEYLTAYLPPSIPKCRYVARTKLPTVWRREEVERLAAHLDRGNPVGKRNYAIVLLAAQLGLRVGDIKALQLSSINWEKQAIEIVQSKTKEALTLPLPKDVGWAIIDYLKNGRPITDSKHIFVRHLAPFEALSINNSLYNVVAVCAKKAGIAPIGNQKGMGMHTLRHSLATELLQQNIPLPTISGILGHQSSESTRHYLKVDLNSLRQCALREVFDLV